MKPPTQAAHLDGYHGREPSLHILNTLNRYGRTERGFPVYRMVDMESVFEELGGLWHDWDPNLSEQDRGGMVFTDPDTTRISPLRQSMHRPTRIVAEVRTVPKYSHVEGDGWVLERWYPAAYFGTPEGWDSLRVPGTNVPRFGAYPHSGQYELATGVFEQEPTQSFLEDFIAGWEQHRESFPENIAKHVQARVDRARLADEERVRRISEENEYRLRSGVDQLSSSTNFEGGRLRQQAMQNAGLNAHVGN